MFSRALDSFFRAPAWKILKARDGLEKEEKEGEGVKVESGVGAAVGGRGKGRGLR